MGTRVLISETRYKSAVDYGRNSWLNARFRNEFYLVFTSAIYQQRQGDGDLIRGGGP